MTCRVGCSTHRGAPPPDPRRRERSGSRGGSAWESAEDSRVGPVWTWWTRSSRGDVATSWMTSVRCAPGPLGRGLPSKGKITISVIRALRTRNPGFAHAHPVPLRRARGRAHLEGPGRPGVGPLRLRRGPLSLSAWALHSRWVKATDALLMRRIKWSVVVAAPRGRFHGARRKPGPADW